MIGKHQLETIILLVIAALVCLAVAAAQILYFSPIEKKYTVAGPEILFDDAASAEDGLAAIKDKLLKHPLYLGLQQFGNWPPDFSKIKFLQTNPFIQ